jgi:tetratricopeptide (TPR) repeat protein
LAFSLPTRTRWRGRALTLALALLASAINPAHAEPSTEGRELARGFADEGANAYAAGDYGRALTLFREAYRLVPAPTVALFEARTLVKLGRSGEARDAYSRLVQTKLGDDSPKAFQDAVQTGRSELDALEQRLRAEQRAAGPTRTAPPRAVEHGAGRTWSFVALGVGGAGLALGVAGGLVALDARRDAERGCPDHRCVAGSRGARDVERFRAWRTASTVGYVVGGVGLGAGAALLFTTGGDSPTQVAITPAWGGASLGAAW